MTVKRRADGAYTAGPPPDGRTVDEHLDELITQGKRPMPNDPTFPAAPAAPAELRPMSEAPTTGPCVEILAKATDRYGNMRWLVVHHAQGGGDDQPPFRGWFHWGGGINGYIDIDPKLLLGWLPLPVMP